MQSKLISIVIPMYNEEDNIAPLYEELMSYICQLTYFTNYEIIAVNDGSKDTTLQKLITLSNHDKNFKVVSFARNFGHEQATLAGIHAASGEAVMLIDADRQDPPALMLEFEKEYRNGFDIVFGQRTKRLNESWLKKLTSRLFYPTFKYLTNVDIPRNVGDFCLLSHKVVSIIKAMPEKTIFVRGLIYWTGLPKKAVPFIRRSRGSGTSKYNYKKLTLFALDNIISFSTAPIHFIIFFSLFTIAGCFIGMGIALAMRLLGYVVMLGWTSLFIAMLFLFSCMLFCFGIIGLYIGKIFQEIKQRPIYLIDKKINFEENTAIAYWTAPIDTVLESQTITAREK